MTDTYWTYDSGDGDLDHCYAKTRDMAKHKAEMAFDQRVDDLGTGDEEWELCHVEMNDDGEITVLKREPLALSYEQPLDAVREWGNVQGEAMKLSFEGVRSNALRQLRDIEELAKTAPDYDEYEHQIGMIEMCISAYHDCLLGLMTGKVDLEEIKGFLLAYKTPEQIATLPYCGMVVSFEEHEEGQP